MKTASAAYNTERAKLSTEPRYLVRFFHLKQFGDSTDYAFRAQFATGTIAGATKTTLLYAGRIQGGTSAVQPEQGRASVGGFQIELVDVSGEMTRYLSAPALTLKTAMTAAVPAAGGFVEANEATDGMPAEGTLEITTAGVIERVRYDLRDDVGKRFRVATAGRGVDGTTAASHAIGDAVTNGEQIRPGQRVQLLAGYAAINEADFMSFTKMEIVSRALAADGVTWVIQCQDIQRALRRQIFLTASKDAPVLLSGNPIDIALQVLTSTGTQTANGAYDLLAVENGLGVPQALVDVAGLESLRSTHFSGQTYRFKVTGAADGKQWLEQNIWRSLNCYSVVTQDGKLTAKRFQPAPAPGSVSETLTETDLIGADWISGDPMIVNRVLVQFDWDLPTAPGAFGTGRFYTFDASKTKYGPRPVLTLPLPGVRGDGSPSDANVLAIIDDRAYTIGKRFAEPPPALKCRAFYRNHLWEIGDLLKLTYSQVPNLKTGKRGLTAEVFEIVDLTPRFPPAGGYLELTLLHTGAITVPAAPSAGLFIQAERRGVQTLPVTPGGLELLGQGNDATFTGRDVKVRWNSVSLTPSSGIDEDNLATQADTSVGYAVVVKVGGTEKRRAVVSSPEYTYPWEQNVEDNGAAGARTLTIEVRARSGILESDPAALVVTNAAPDMSAVTPTLTVVPEGTLVEWVFAELDADFDHYDIAYDTTSPPTLRVVTVSKGTQRVLLANEALSGATLYVRVTPFDAFGAGTASAIASLARAPAAPTGLTATARPGFIELDWTDSTEPDLSEYGVYRNTVDVFGSATKIAEVRASRFLDSGLVAGTPYFYWVTAIDRSENASGASTSASATFQGSPSSDAPADPSAPTFSTSGTYQASDGRTSAFAVITMPAMPSGGAYMNALFRINGQTPWQIADQVSTGGGTVRIDDLVPAQVYQFAVQAFSGGGGASAIVLMAGTHTGAGDTTAPAVPTGLAASVGTGKLVELRWTANTDSDLDEYQVYRDTASPATTLIGQVRTTKFVDTNVVIGTTYFYRLKALDRSKNASGFSSEVSAAPSLVLLSEADTTAPSQPGTFAKVAEGSYLAGDGTVLAYLDFTLPAMPTNGVLLNLLYKPTAAAQYLIAGQVDAGSVTLRIDDLTPGRQYDVACQAASRFGSLSTVRVATSSPFTAPGDTTAPGDPSAIAVRQGGGKTVEIEVTHTEPADWAFTELYRHTSDASGSATLIDRQKSKQFTDQDVSYFDATVPTAPSAAQGAAGNVNTGLHTWKVTFARTVVAGEIPSETMAGTASAQLNVSTPSIVNLTSVPIGPAGTASRKIYRTVAGDTGSYKLVGTIADNTTTTFNDNVADASLGAASPVANSFRKTYYYWTKVVDLSGNLSGFSPSSGHSVVMIKLLSDDISNLSVSRAARAYTSSVSDSGSTEVVKATYTDIIRTVKATDTIYTIHQCLISLSNPNTDGGSVVVRIRRGTTTSGTLIHEYTATLPSGKNSSSFKTQGQDFDLEAPQLANTNHSYVLTMAITQNGAVTVSATVTKSKLVVLAKSA